MGFKLDLGVSGHPLRLQYHDEAASTDDSVVVLGSPSLEFPGLDPLSGRAGGSGNAVPGPTRLADSGGAQRGAGYARVSDRSQAENTSLAKQRENILADAKRCCVHIPPEYMIEEVWSGADHGRPGIQRLCSLVEAHLIEHVFFNDSDRAARDPWHLLQLIRLCKENGVLVHFTDGSVVETVFDEAIQYLKGFFGYQEREMISRRTQDGKRRVAKQGCMPHGVGRGIYGYDYDPVTKTRSINEAEAAVVRELFQRALGGVSSNVMSKDLQTRGITTKTGSRFDARKIYHILRNETYTGSHWWGRNRFEKMPTTPHGPKRRVTLQPPERWIRMTKFSPQIITPNLGAAVQ